MNLKDLLTSKDSPPELFWALVIEKGLVQAGIWYIEGGKAEVTGIGSIVPWENDENLIESTDAALSSAIQKIPEDYPEPQKTVFGVSTSWVKDGEISSENLGKIKKLCTELSLTPVGFVVLPEAIAHFYKSEEGTPLNAIVVKSGSDNLELSIFKSGSLAGATDVSRSVSLVDDVIEGLSRLSGINPLPTRFVVYDGKEGDLEEVKQILLNANWGEGKIEFLHTPQVEVLETDKKVLAVALAGGAEIGDATAVVTVDEGEEVLPKENEETKSETPEKIASAEDVGFSLDEDILSIENVQDVTSSEPQTQSVPSEFSAPSISPSIVEKKTATDYFAKSKNLFHSFSKKLFSQRRIEQSKTKKGIVVAAIIAAVTVLGVFVLWWFVQGAKISIYVTPKRAEENVQITFDTGGSYDLESGVIPAKTLTDQISGEKTKSVTGTKTVGEKATGTVQIANGNSSAINLAAGTILTAASGYKFTTVSSASVSGQLLPGSPGTTSVDVVAYDVGASYNLAKGEVFSVGNYSKSLVAATSTGDFTGGSSYQVSAVGKDDQTSLENDLKNELINNIKSELTTKISEDQVFVTDLAELLVTEKKFDKNVGDAAESLKLYLTIDATALTANKSNLLEYASNVLNGKAPSGYTLTSDQIDFRFTLVSTTDGKYLYDVTVGGNFLPIVKTDEIKKMILGKTSKVATEYLNSIPGFDHANVSLKIKVPGFLEIIPRISKNVTIDVKPE